MTIHVARKARADDSTGRARKLAALGVVCCVLSGASGALAYSRYVDETGWHYLYSLHVSPVGNQPEAIVVPIPSDDACLTGLHLDSGIANWSFIDTSLGRGLYVGFSGNASLHVSRFEYPKPTPRYNCSLTMEESYDTYWVYYDGNGKLSLHLVLQGEELLHNLVPGWSTYDFNWH